MAVVPLRRGVDDPRGRIEIEEEPRPSPRAGAVVTIGEDGSTEIEIASSRPAARQKKKPGGREFDRNLAEDIDAGSLSALAAFLLEGIEADDADRKEWTETVDMVPRYLGVKLEDPVSVVGVDGTVCQVVATCMLEAAVKLWSTSYAELLPVGGPVKVERKDAIPASASSGAGEAGLPGGISAGLPMDGGQGIAGGGASEPGQQPVTQGDVAGDDLAEALEKDLNWYLTVGDRGYYPDTSKMLMQRCLVGVEFKEVYRCSVARKPLSRWVRAQDLIVQGDPADINETDGRVTVRKRVSQARMRRMQKSGEYLDVVLVHPTGQVSETEIVIGEVEGVTPTPSLPRDYDHTVYECSCELGSGTAHDLFGDLELLDLDEEGRDPGYPLPYRVSIDLDSRTVLGIRRNWKKNDDDHRRRKRFVKYGFLPAFGFYDWGLIHLVGNPTQAATMLQRSGVDAAVLANFPSWVGKQGPGTKLEQTVFRPNPGEVMKWPASGSDKIQDSIMPFPYKEPSAQSMALGAKLEGNVKSLAGVIELPVGEGRLGNTPVGTIMSYIESVSMVPGAVHKMDHVSQAEEFELLRDLLAEEPGCLTRGNKKPARLWQAAQELLDPDLAPKADPNTPSQMHRLLKIQGLVQASGLPQFNMPEAIPDQRAIWQELVQTLRGEDADRYTLPKQAPQQAPPDPKIQAAQIKAQSQSATDQARLQEADLNHKGKLAELAVESQDRAADREAANQREALKAGVAHARAGAEMVTEGAGLNHEAQQNALGHQHEAQQQAGQQAHEANQSALSGPEGGEGE